MKRSFSALFVLLTALSGPLVFTPPAISRQDAAQNQSDERNTSALSRTEADQPVCTFPLEGSMAPEDLVVVPEDFDYEIYDEPRQCEIEQNAASQSVQNATVPEYQPNPSAADVALGANLESLCLPFVEYEFSDEAWDGPPIAGLSPAEAAENFEATECEIAAAEYAAVEFEREQIARNEVYGWIINTYYEKSYAIAIQFEMALQDALFSFISSAQWVDNVGAWQADHMLRSTIDLGRHSLERLANEFQVVSQTIYGSRLTETAESIPTPPYCECWAKPSTESRERDECETDAGTLQNLIAETVTLDADRVIEGIIPSSPASGLNKAEVPSFSEQNDVFEQPIEEVEVNQTPAPAIDFAGLQDAAEKLWAAGLEKIEALERLSNEYEFEPNHTNELKFVTPLRP
jgi:hypothetical protein